MRIDIVIPSINRHAKLVRCIHSILANDYLDYRIVVVSDYDTKLAFKIWNEYMNITHFDAMFYLADDTALHPDCLTKLVECMKANYPNLDGMVGANQVNLRDGSPSAFGLIGRTLAGRFPMNHCFCPDYTNLYADEELRKFAESINRFTFCPEAKVDHFHPAHYKSEVDEIHRRSKHFKSQNHPIYKERKKRNLIWGKSWGLINK